MIDLPDLPGKTQQFQAWSPDGRAVLFTAPAGDSATLYRLELDGGRLTKLAEGADLAAWGGESIAFIAQGPTPTLRVLDAESGESRWEADLGSASQGDMVRARPVIFGQQIAYQSGGGWWVSPLDRKEPVQVYRGAGDLFIGSPDGRHAAIIDTASERLTVVSMDR